MPEKKHADKDMEGTDKGATRRTNTPTRSNKIKVSDEDGRSASSAQPTDVKQTQKKEGPDELSAKLWRCTTYLPRVLWRCFTFVPRMLCSRRCCCGCILFVVFPIIALLAYLGSSFTAWREAELAKDMVCPGEQMTAGDSVKDFKPLSWDESYLKAEKLLSEMTSDEKYTLMQGRGWVLADPKKYWYTGNTVPMPQHGIPSMNMQDAAGGFRTMWSEIVGTVTCWPSGLAMAATWDPEVVGELATAMAEEFAGKGATMVLGPSVQVHRVARNGRNFEYMSGEDPYLGSHLVKAYVNGFTSRGVMTSAKHYGFNEQETNRNWQDSVLDIRTAYELYYPPFQSAIDAGITTVMCGYNKVDGEYACSSKRQLTDILRGELGFRGFVQSDWWATHPGPSVEAGLDQEMPGNALNFDSIGNFIQLMSRNCSIYYAKETLAKLPQQVIDTSAMRILASMFRMGQIGKKVCTPPCCELLMRTNTTGLEHQRIARKAATHSVVLLKNHKNVLPISATTAKSIAVIGSVAIGKSHDPLGSSQAADGGEASSWNMGDYYSGGGSGHVASGNTITPLAGIQSHAAMAGVRVVTSTTENRSEAIRVAAEVDIAIVVCGATAGEGVDREHLNLDHGANEMIALVASVAKHTVVIMQVPGAVLMPWRDSVDAAALMFLGGQETGNAWGAVLFGDHAPSGKLPLMIPATMDDTIEPGFGEQVRYEEGLRTSYRNPDFEAAYPFGHGLTYTTFEYGQLDLCTPRKDASLCLKLDVANSGKVSAGTTVQLYIEFPTLGRTILWPETFLKGYLKTGTIHPGKKATVTFQLSTRDVSYADCMRTSCKWKQASSLLAHVGESSEDIRGTLQLREDTELHRWVQDASPGPTETTVAPTEKAPSVPTEDL